MSRTPTAPVLEEVSGRELLVLLDQELQQLTSRLRTPLILCYLQEKTQSEAAHLLGCSLETVQRRLVAGRARLQRRLRQRGVTLPLALLITAVAGTSAMDTLPQRLMASTVWTVMTALERPDVQTVDLGDVVSHRRERGE